MLHVKYHMSTLNLARLHSEVRIDFVLLLTSDLFISSNIHAAHLLFYFTFDFANKSAPVGFWQKHVKFIRLENNVENGEHARVLNHFRSIWLPIQ